MMPYSQEQLDAATRAIQTAIAAEIAKDIPAMFQSRIPAASVAKFSAALAKAALDAAA